MSAASTCHLKTALQAHLFLKKAMELFSAVVDAQPVCGIDNPD
jgi:hypothetical protein